MQLNTSRLLNWKMYHVDGSGSVIKGAKNLFNISSQQLHQYSKKEFSVPAVAIFSFHVSEAKDTFLKLDAWTKVSPLIILDHWHCMKTDKCYILPLWHVLNVYNHEHTVTDYDIINYELYDRGVFRTQSDIYDGAFCKNS